MGMRRNGGRTRSGNLTESHDSLWPHRCEMPGRHPYRQVGRGLPFTGEVWPEDRAQGATRVERVLRAGSLHNSLEFHHLSPKSNFSHRAGPPIGSSPFIPTACRGEVRPHAGRQTVTSAKGKLLSGMRGHWHDEGCSVPCY